MNKFKVKQDKAQLILERFLKTKITDWKKDEIPAIASHWLQNMDEPPLLVEQSASELKEVLNIELGFTKSDKVEIDFSDFPFPPTVEPKFRFIDLFAGIGGFRLALQKQGGKCVFSSDWDKAAKRTYYRNFGEYPFGDINKFTDVDLTDEQINKMIPDHQILAGGFPCQPFSRAGVSARSSLGQKSGFDDEKQGNLFFDIVRIAKIKKPKVLFLENVKNLRSHDHGNTFKVIENTIKDELKYSFDPQVINANKVVPQKRERCYMICFDGGNKKFEFPVFDGPEIALKTILQKDVPDGYTISDKLWLGHQRRTERNIGRGTGFTAFEANLDKPANTLVARYGKDGKECLIPQKGKNPRKLTPRECARLMGYPDNYLTAESNAASYRQFGNSVAVPVIEAIAKKIIKDI